MDVCEKILLVFLLIIADTATVEVRVKIPHSRITPFYNVVLECSYDFGNENPYMLSWYKDTKEFFRYKFKENFIQVFPVAGVNVNIQLSSSHQIVLENVSSATNGEYLCEVTGNPPKHIIAFDADHLKISDASPVQVKLSSNLVKTGKNVTLQCLYDEKKAYSIRWFRDNLEFFNYTFGDNRSQILPLNGIHINNEESSANKVVLVNVSQQTSGEYKCQVRTNYPNVSLIMTDSNYLNVSDYPFELKISKAEVKPGENVTLSCLYDFGEENMYSIKWYKDNEEFFRYVFRDNRTSFFTVDGVNVNRQLSSSNKVILENVRGKTEGLYMCEVSMDAPSFFSISGYRQLKLSGMYSLQVKVPDRLVKPGEDVTLWCLYYFGDDELYSIKWYKENSEFFRYEPWRNGTYVFPIRGIQVNEKQSSADRVVLKNVSTEADGKYTCIVEAEAPTFSSSMNTSYLHIMRVPSEKPVITVKHHVIPEGEKFICKCMIPSSYPKSELTWSLNGKKVIGENEYRDNLTSNTFYLTLRDNSKAELTCTARIFENEIQDLYNEKTTIVLKRNQHFLTDSYESTRQPTNISFVSAVAKSTTIEAQTLKIIVVVMCLLWFC